MKKNKISLKSRKGGLQTISLELDPEIRLDWCKMNEEEHFL